MSSGHEARINEALRRLGEEFRLGMAPVEEYRARRRLLLESWGERDVTTVPGSLRNRSVTSAAAGAAQVRPRSRRSRWMVLAVFAAAVTLLYALLHFKRPAVAPDSQPPAAAVRSLELVALTRAATDFVNQNRWGESEIDVFLRQWRLLSQTDRARARQEPAVRTLRHELAQNLQAESQTPGGEVDSAQAQRFARLQQFARELDADEPN